MVDQIKYQTNFTQLIIDTSRMRDGILQPEHKERVANDLRLFFEDFLLWYSEVQKNARQNRIRNSRLG